MGEPETSLYLAPRGQAEALIRERSSRFLACLQGISDKAQAAAAIAALKRRHHDATHHCWAWRLGPAPEEKSSDAGEPPGTAGRPILQVLRGAGVSDVVAVVVRWFGGIRLGRGGLSRAYASATREAMALLPTVQRAPTIDLELEVSYADLARLRHLARNSKTRVLHERFADTVRLSLRVHEDHRPELEDRLHELGLSWTPRAE